MMLMKLIQYPLWIIYRVWFYVLVGLTIIVLLPLLFISVLKSSWYPFFFRLARVWSKCILLGMGFYWQTKWVQELEKGQSYIFVANHTSMTDIMLMFVVIKNHPFVFVGKKELVVLPVFGFFYKRVCIMVDRENRNGRKAVYRHAERRLKQGLSLCIFAEGLVTSPEIKLAPFKNGVFRFSIHCQIPIVPMSFYDCERRYPYHFSYNHYVGGPGLLRAKVHNHIDTKGLKEKDMENLKQKVYDFMLADLEPRL